MLLSSVFPPKCSTEEKIVLWQFVENTNLWKVIRFVDDRDVGECSKLGIKYGCVKYVMSVESQ